MEFVTITLPWPHDMDVYKRVTFSIYPNPIASAIAFFAQENPSHFLPPVVAELCLVVFCNPLSWVKGLEGDERNAGSF